VFFKNLSAILVTFLYLFYYLYFFYSSL